MTRIHTAVTGTPTVARRPALLRSATLFVLIAFACIAPAVKPGPISDFTGKSSVGAIACNRPFTILL